MGLSLNDLHDGGRTRPRTSPLPQRVRRILHRLAVPLLAFAFISCAAQESRAPRAYDQRQAEEMFSTGYYDISDIFIEEREISALAMAGLEGLSHIDPAIEIKRIGSLVAMEVDGVPAGRHIAPEANDADGWADITVAALSDGRKFSVALGEADAERIYDAVFGGMVSELDAYSRYSGLEEAQENRASRDGFGGIGVRIDVIDEGVKVLSVMDGTPADLAGLLDDDLIVQIGDEPAAGLSQRRAVRRLRGPIGTKVRLTVKRPGRTEALEIAVTRSHIVPETVEFRAEGKIAYFRVSGFNQSTAENLEQRIRQAKEQMGPELGGMIVDLRDNPGGLLDQAVDVADLFVAGGRIVSTHGRHPDSHQYFDAQADFPAGEIPVAVLINSGSASASEIVAAALQDVGRAVVIGSNSYGKGTVQTVLRLPNEGELTLTWAQFHAPSGYGLQGRGVLPDICTSQERVTSADDVFGLLQSGQMPIAYATRIRNVDSKDLVGLEHLRAACPGREGDNEIDMKVALHLLTTPELYARALGESPGGPGSGNEARRGALSAKVGCGESGNGSC
jgi:carboxyl-terminal processing protease